MGGLVAGSGNRSEVMNSGPHSIPQPDKALPVRPTQPFQVVELPGPGAGLAAAYAGWLLAKLGARVRVLDVVDASQPTCSDSPLRLARRGLLEGKHIVSIPRGSAQVQDLLDATDVLICDEPNSLAVFSPTVDELASRFPQLMIGMVTHFGLQAQGQGFSPTALDAQALSATAWSLGEASREPLSLPVGVAEHQAGAMLAAACLLAQCQRERTGRGSVIDIALVEVLASHVAGNCRVYIHHGLKWHRNGRRPYGSCGAYPYAILPCKDGDICISGRTRAEWERLVQAMGHPAWANEPRYQDLRAMGTRYPEEGDALLAPWLMQHSRDELEALALKHNLILSPLRKLDEVLATPQFHHRQFIGSRVIDGVPRQWPSLPFRVTARRFEAEPDRSRELLSQSPAPSSPGKAAGDRSTGPLSGLRVLDFGWVWSAPWVGTMLGEMGAEVIKVEHGARPDNVRLAGKVFRDGRMVEGPSREMSPMFHQINHGKLGITLNLKEPRAVALAKALAGRSDLVIENMSPGSMERSGLGFEVLRGVNPKLVMLSMSAAGQFGPAATLRAYAPTMSAFAGLEPLVGYRGGAPIGALNFALCDPNASLHGLLAALAALSHARATGEGTYIDLSQVEALVSVLRPQLLAAQRQGSQPSLSGNTHPEMAPHGIYPALGKDRWLSIAVENESGWRALIGLARGAGFAADPRFTDITSRLQHSAALDEALAEWTGQHERDGMVAQLRAQGIAASPVQSVEEMWSDALLQQRRASAPVHIPFLGSERVFRAPWRFSGIEATIDRPGPRLGEHNALVFGGILGLSEPEIAEFAAAGVIG